MKAILALEDGTIFTGISFGATGTVTGEACFHTAMAGYQEILTDPASRGQIAAITYPQVGNYGICEDDNESTRPQAAALVIGELSRLHSSWRADEPLADWLARYGVLGIEGVDTRRLTRILSTKGTLCACLTTELSEEEAIARAAVHPCGADLVSAVTTEVPYQWEESEEHVWKLPSKMVTDGTTHSTLPEIRYNIVALDLGIKRNTLRGLRRAGFGVTVVPVSTTAQDILAMNADGLFLSSGPGDPAVLTAITDEIAKLIGKLPIFGIALGHQLLALACGGKTERLTYGHHGANHPVKDLRTGTVAITSQNHAFTAVADSLPPNVEVTHVNLNDGSVEGIRLTDAPAAAVQDYPGSAPGATAVPGFFNDFAAMIDAFKAAR